MNWPRNPHEKTTHSQMLVCRATILYNTSRQDKENCIQTIKTTPHCAWPEQRKSKCLVPTDCVGVTLATEPLQNSKKTHYSKRTTPLCKIRIDHNHQLPGTPLLQLLRAQTWLVESLINCKTESCLDSKGYYEMNIYVYISLNMTRTN